MEINSQDNPSRWLAASSQQHRPAGQQLAPGRLLLVAVVLGLVAIGMRLPFRSHMPLTWDSVQYVLGIIEYNITLHQPHPPGYFLYIHTAKVLHWLGVPAYTVLVALSLVAGGFTVALLVWWSGQLLGRQGVLVAAVFTLFSPLAWVYSIHGDTYAISGLFSLLVGYLCWRMLTRASEPLWPAALAIGIAGGFRPSDALFLLPLWLWSMRRRRWSEVGGALMIFGVVSVAWLVPMIISAGGLADYRAASGQLSSMVMNLSPVQGNMAEFRIFATYVIGGAAALVLAAWPLAFFAGRRHFPCIMDDQWAWVFVGLWSLPALLFYFAIHFGQGGYMLLLLPPVLLVVTTGAVRLSRSLSSARFGIMLALIIGLNFAFTWSTFIVADRQRENSFTGIARALADFGATDTVALTGIPRVGQTHTTRPMLNFRLAMCLLPDISVYNFPLEKSLRGGGSPNYGYQMTSAKRQPPVVLRGVRHLLLLDPELRRYLPPDTPTKLIWDDSYVQISLIALDSAAPLTLGPEKQLEFTAASNLRN